MLALTQRLMVENVFKDLWKRNENIFNTLLFCQYKYSRYIRDKKLTLKRIHLDKLASGVSVAIRNLCRSFWRGFPVSLG